MKKIIIFTAFSCICLKINAQDIIYTISKDSILAKIIEVNDTDINYCWYQSLIGLFAHQGR